MNPSIHSSSLGEWQGRLISLTLVWQFVEEIENSEFKPVKLCFKIDLVLHLARSQGLGKYVAINKITQNTGYNHKNTTLDLANAYTFTA